MQSYSSHPISPELIEFVPCPFKLTLIVSSLLFYPSSNPRDFINFPEALFPHVLALSGGVVVLLLTLHAEDWVFKPSLRQAVQANKL